MDVFGLEDGSNDTLILCVLVYCAVLSFLSDEEVYVVTLAVACITISLKILKDL
jgi:hypothetical protein